MEEQLLFSLQNRCSSKLEEKRLAVYLLSDTFNELFVNFFKNQNRGLLLKTNVLKMFIFHK